WSRSRSRTRARGWSGPPSGGCSSVSGAAIRAAASTAPASDWRSHKAWSRRRAGASGRRTARAAARGWRSLSRSRPELRPTCQMHSQPTRPGLRLEHSVLTPRRNDEPVAGVELQLLPVHEHLRPAGEQDDPFVMRLLEGSRFGELAAQDLLDRCRRKGHELEKSLADRRCAGGILEPAAPEAVRSQAARRRESV